MFLRVREVEDLVAELSESMDLYVPRLAEDAVQRIAAQVHAHFSAPEDEWRLEVAAGAVIHIESPLLDQAARLAFALENSRGDDEVHRQYRAAVYFERRDGVRDLAL